MIILLVIEIFFGRSKKNRNATNYHQTKTIQFIVEFVVFILSAISA